MNNTPRIVMAMNLLPGNVTCTTKYKIIAVYPMGLNIPKGKVEIHYVNKHGETRKAFWNKYTRINIE